MSTVAEILDAVKQLSPKHKQEFMAQLESVLIAPSTNAVADERRDYLSPEFTARLVEHFHRAKRAVLSQS